MKKYKKSFVKKEIVKEPYYDPKKGLSFNLNFHLEPKHVFDAPIIIPKDLEDEG